MRFLSSSCVFRVYSERENRRVGFSFVSQLKTYKNAEKYRLNLKSVNVYYVSYNKLHTLKRLKIQPLKLKKK